MSLLSLFAQMLTAKERAASRPEIGSIIRFTKTSPTAQAPTYGTDGAAGLDLYADEHAWVFPHDRKLVKINIAIELPSHLCAYLMPRSGLAMKKGVTVLNSPGLIDPDYRGSLGVLLYNSTDDKFEVNPGDRIGQLVIAPFHRANLVEADALDRTDRGAKGWGSTGVGQPKVQLEGYPLLLADAHARQAGVNLDGSPRRETRLTGAALYEAIDNIPDRLPRGVYYAGVIDHKSLADCKLRFPNHAVFPGPAKRRAERLG